MTTLSYETELNKVLKGNNVCHDLPVSQLVERALDRKEGILTSTGALRATTGKYTGRSPKDKYFVEESSVKDKINWGSTNQPISEETFEILYKKVLAYLETKDEIYVSKNYSGADKNYRLPIKVVNEYAWHNLFARQLFIQPTEAELTATEEGKFTVISAPGFKADPAVDGTKSETFIIISFEKRIVLIGGTEYAGEIKKSIFTIMNYLLPEQNVLSMHCSANVGDEGDVALFFGLSGTGKTTLSADPMRHLIGDDEHGWSNTGVFNIEGGCYAKCINLSEQKEPQIFNAIRFGSVLENVVLDENRNPDYDDTSLTENTRAAYPLELIPNSVIPSVSGHPSTIIFLTADAFGVLPPISNLTKEQAMFHFLSGYTSKLAGTELGVTSPEATFSTCFGAPFLPLPAYRYAEMLGKKIDQHEAKVFLVNTGWSGGEYGVGKRMNLAYTRAMVQAALQGELNSVETVVDPIFNLNIPIHCPGVPDEVLQPKETWTDKAAYDLKATHLANQFQENFKKFDKVSAEIRNAGPKI